MFDYRSVEKITYPFNEAIRFVSIGRYITNVETFFIAIWLIAVVIKFTVYIYIVCKIFGFLFQIIEFEYCILPITLLILIIAMIPENNEINMFEIRAFVSNYYKYFLLLLPLLLWVFSRIKEVEERLRLYFFLLLLTLPFVLTGCWDQKELEERSYVVAIGLDLPKGININKEQAIDVIFQFSNPKLNIKGASPSTESEIQDIVTLTAPDIVSARNMANSFVTREISLSHNKVLIVSEELAKKEIFYRILSMVFKDREMRRETNIIVTDGKASEFIAKNNPEMMVRPHRYYQFLLDLAAETGLVQNQR